MSFKSQEKAGAMRRLSYFLIFLSSLLPLHGFAQEEQVPQEQTDGGSGGPRKHIAGISLGQHFLFGNWGDAYNDALGFGAFYIYEASPVFGFTMNLGLSSHDSASATGGTGSTATTNTDDSLKVITIEPGIRVNFAYFDSLVFYGAGGFGLYSVSQTQMGTSAGGLCFGMNLAVGLDLRVNNTFSFGPGLQFRSVFTKTDAEAVNSANPSGMTVGGEMIRLYVQAGYMF